MAAPKQIIPLGSGFIYCTEFSGTIPEDAALETDENRLGYIEGGAELSYTPSTQTVKDDYGIVQRTILTAEEATLAASLIAWSYANIDKFATTARIDETTKTGHRLIKIGGVKNDSQKKYLYRFHHPDAEFGDVRVTVVGTQTGGLTIKFKPEEAGNLDLEVTAQAQDGEGTLIMVDEEVKA